MQMKKMKMTTLVLLILGCMSSCNTNNIKQVSLEGATLEIRASLTPKFRKFTSGNSKIEGNLSITNKTPFIQSYGNEFLQLKVNGNLIARTYLNNLSSNAIDFAIVEIKPHTTISIPVYWVFNVPTSTKVNSVRLELDEKGIANEQRRITSGGSSRAAAP